MEICIFYSWQSKYRKNCDNIITKALEKAIKELNAEKPEIQYTLERGGGDVLGAEHIDNNIDEIIKTRADLAFVDFTHNGALPKKNEETGEWQKEKCMPNTNAVYENGKLEAALNVRQVFKVYNTEYGDLNTNLEMPFDLHQEHFPLAFRCSDETTEEERQSVKEKLKKGIKSLILKGTEDFLKKQKVRFAPLVPLRNEYEKAFYKSAFLPVTLAHDNF